ncbi:MAG TPA: hypothetical protein VH482_13375 [Thermomicrobiales bacterium]
MSEADDRDRLGRIAYEADLACGTVYGGADDYDDLPIVERMSWQAVAAAVREAVLPPGYVAVERGGGVGAGGGIRRCLPRGEVADQGVRFVGEQE